MIKRLTSVYYRVVFSEIAQSLEYLEKMTLCDVLPSLHKQIGRFTELGRNFELHKNAGKKDDLNLFHKKN